MADPSLAEKGRKFVEMCSLFATLDERARKELASHAQPRRFPAGAAIFHAGEPGQSMMAVLTGTVRISLQGAKGKEIILADLPAGELFGEIALIDGKGRSADARALTDCELLVLDRRYVVSFLERDPSAGLKVMEMLCARIRRSDERMSDIAFSGLPARLAKALLNYPAQGQPPAKISITQADLADMAGGTREYVNRCLHEWQSHGILELKRRGIVILKPDALRALASDAGS
jgi:CRP-like cAMP-binding protein